MYKFKFYHLGYHCDDCWNVNGMDFDCPVCQKRQHTDIWADLHEWFDDDDKFSCTHCGTIFMVKVKVGGYDEWEFDIV